MATKACDLAVHPEFQQAVRPLNPVERSRLESLILEDGKIRDSIKFWHHNGENFVVDGHVRLDIYDKAGRKLPAPPLEELFFDNEDAVIAWIVKWHTSRRNLTRDELQKLCDEKAPGMIAKTKESQVGAVIKGNKSRASSAAPAELGKEAAEMIQDAVEQETGMRPTRAMARNATKKARASMTKTATNGKASLPTKTSRSPIHDDFIKLVSFCLARDKVTKQQFRNQIKTFGRHAMSDFVRALLTDTGPFISKYELQCDDNDYQLVEREPTAEYDRLKQIKKMADRLYRQLKEGNNARFDHAASFKFAKTVRELLPEYGEF